MGKGDKKSRRGKIVMGSNGVRRPRKKRKAIVVAATTVKVKKVVEKAKPEPKPKAKAAEPVVVSGSEIAPAPEKAVKKTVKKAKAEGTTE